MILQYTLAEVEKIFSLDIDQLKVREFERDAKGAEIPIGVPRAKRSQDDAEFHDYMNNCRPDSSIILLAHGVEGLSCCFDGFVRFHHYYHRSNILLKFPQYEARMRTLLTNSVWEIARQGWIRGDAGMVYAVFSLTKLVGGNEHLVDRFSIVFFSSGKVDTARVKGGRCTP